MIKILALTAAIGAASVLLAASATAMPVAPLGDATAESDITLVRDGCGRGMRWSNRAGDCVWERRHFAPPPPRRVSDAEIAVGTAAAVLGIIGATQHRSHHGGSHRSWKRKH
jgi:hypothetical protein